MLLRQDAHQTEFKMSCVAVQQTAVNPIRPKNWQFFSCFFLPVWTPVEQNHGCATSQNIFPR